MPVGPVTNRATTISVDTVNRICERVSTMEHLEIELKFFIGKHTSLSTRLSDRGAVCIDPRHFEHNIRYDTADGRLQKNRCLLRLRRDQHVTLTFKSPPPAADRRFKVHREREVHLDDFDTMDAMLGELGYTNRQVYQKWRENWRLGETVLSIDTLPYGGFLEIEGLPASIMQTVDEIGLDWHRRILASYLEIFAVLRDRASLPFNDVTFDNFRSVDIGFHRYRHLFETGPTDVS